MYIEKMKEFVRSSMQRQKVLKSLAETAKTPSKISTEVGMRVQNVSRALKQLQEKELVRCKTPERNMNRVYELTEKGEEIQNTLASQGLLIGRKFETEIMNLLDSCEIPYSRNEKIPGGKFEIRPDFYISTGRGDKLVVEAKVVRKSPGIELVKQWAFTAKDMKGAVNGIKAVLFVKGTSRQEELGQKILEIKEPEYFDEIFFEDEIAEFRDYVEEFL